MEQLSHCLCTLITEITEVFKSSCDQNKASCTPMGIKNVQKKQVYEKKQTSGNYQLEFQWSSAKVNVKRA